MPSPDVLTAYWLPPIVAANLVVLFSILGALVLGVLMGYERSYHGHAAGMRTYGLVCMPAAGLTVVTGYPQAWFGGGHTAEFVNDPMHVVQGIVTGIGFLCAGVILRDGFHISGLSTAASLWSSAVGGVLVGLGFYPAAIVLALGSALSMTWVARFETWLPRHQAIAVNLSFQAEFIPSREDLRQWAQTNGYDVSEQSIVVQRKTGGYEWQFLIISKNLIRPRGLNQLAEQLAQHAGVSNFELSYARN